MNDEEDKGLWTIDEAFVIVILGVASWALGAFVVWLFLGGK